MHQFSDQLEPLLQLANEGKWKDLVSVLETTPGLARVRDRFGSTLLIELLPYAPLDVVKKLISSGAELNIVNGEGFSCLHKVVEEGVPGHENLLTLLIAKGANPDIRGWNGWTPLHQAVSYGLPAYARTLLENGASLDVRTGIDDDETPMMIAKRKGDKRMQELLRRYD